MRIGAFAKQNDISIDTVRHYIDIGLILPDKEGNGQFTFDDRCQEQVIEIQKLKAMGFQLKEIKNLFMYKLLGHMTPYLKDEYYRMFFEDKYTHITEEINQLKSAKNKLAEALKDLESHKDDMHHRIGVPLSALEVLACPSCRSSLTIGSGEIQDHQIIQGNLTCQCGSKYRVDDGILIIGSNSIENSLNFTDNYASMYIRKTDNAYVENLYRGIDWLRRTIDFGNLKGKIVLDLGSGVGFAIRNFYHLLPDDCHYIAVDHDIKRHRFLKRILEKADKKKHIVFVCADFGKIPLIQRSTDLILDFSGSSNYGFEHRAFLMDDVSKYLKDAAHYIAIFILFKKFAINSLVNTVYRNNFSLEHIQKKLVALGFVTLKDQESGSLYHGGEYENYFVEGEEVSSYQFYGKKIEQSHE